MRQRGNVGTQKEIIIPAVSPLFILANIVYLWHMAKPTTRTPKEASALFERIIKASVKGNPKPKAKKKARKK